MMSFPVTLIAISGGLPIGRLRAQRLDDGCHSIRGLDLLLEIDQPLLKVRAHVAVHLQPEVAGDRVQSEIAIGIPRHQRAVRAWEETDASGRWIAVERERIADALLGIRLGDFDRSTAR